MFKTNEEMKRFLIFQQRSWPDCPERMWDRYETYVYCVGFEEHPKTLMQWLGD